MARVTKCTENDSAHWSKYAYANWHLAQQIALVRAGLNGHDGNKNNLRTIEAQMVQKFKNNEARSKITGSYKKSV